MQIQREWFKKGIINTTSEEQCSNVVRFEINEIHALFALILWRENTH